VKLAAAGGVWLGWQLFATTVMLAACGALILVVGHIAIYRGWPRDKRIAFAAFLAPAIWIVWYGAHFVGLG
jgi:leader peptidase (prepilin peptidase)/N-methyltransferase